MMNDVQRPRPKTKVQLTSLSGLSHADLLTHRIVALLRRICDQGFPDSRAKGTDLKRSCIIAVKVLAWAVYSAVLLFRLAPKRDVSYCQLKSFMTDDRIGPSASQVSGPL
jgi:hypothetical protein